MRRGLTSLCITVAALVAVFFAIPRMRAALAQTWPSWARNSSTTTQWFDGSTTVSSTSVVTLGSVTFAAFNPSPLSTRDVIATVHFSCVTSSSSSVNATVGYGIDESTVMSSATPFSVYAGGESITGTNDVTRVIDVPNVGVGSHTLYFLIQLQSTTSPAPMCSVEGIVLL